MILNALKGWSREIVASAVSCVALASVSLPTYATAGHNMATTYASLPKSDYAATHQEMFNTSSREAAIRFLRYTGTNKNLSLMLLNTVKHEGDVQSAIKQFGFNKVQGSVVRAIRGAQLSYDRKWNDMLADVYLLHFEAGELLSILKQKEQSPYFEKLISLQNEISEAVHSQGKGILAEAKQQVMAQLSAEFRAQ